MQAYDIAACKFRGPEAVTNFDIRNYDVHLSQLAQVGQRLTCRPGSAKGALEHIVWLRCTPWCAGDESPAGPVTEAAEQGLPEGQQPVPGRHPGMALTCKGTTATLAVGALLDLTAAADCTVLAAAPERQVGGAHRSGYWQKVQVRAMSSVLGLAAMPIASAFVAYWYSVQFYMFKGRSLLRRYLGLYVTEIEAAIAYDTEAVAQKGILAVTNFALSGYQHLMSASRGRHCVPLHHNIAPVCD